LAKRIAQDLPPVLEGIGVHLELEPKEAVQEDTKEVLKRFRTRPAKYAGREVTIRCRVTGDVLAVDEQDCLALRLPLGDTIERKIVHLVDEYRITSLIASAKIAGWLEELPKNTEVEIRVKLLSGKRNYTEWVEGEPIWSTKLIRAYQITDVIEPE